MVAGMRDDIAPKSSGDLIDVLADMAKGVKVTSGRVTETVDVDGKVSTSKVAGQHTSGPNLEALRDLMELRIGGPQDWC